MVKLKVDQNACTGCGACYNVYPQYLEENNFKAKVREGFEPEDSEVDQIVGTCPVNAIQIDK